MNKHLNLFVFRNILYNKDNTMDIRELLEKYNLLRIENGIQSVLIYENYFHLTKKIEQIFLEYLEWASKEYANE